MPILHYHLIAGAHDDARIGELLTASSRLYAEVLRIPVERVRVYAHLYEPAHVAVAGELASRGAAPAPSFEFLVLEGRPIEDCQALLAGFTDLLVKLLGVERARVRGGCWPIPAHYWAIGGVPASEVRAAEIAARSHPGARASTGDGAPNAG
jgi:4-oxalocrotonate tautomerase